MKVAFITWTDSCEKHGWTNKHDSGVTPVISSVGILVKQTKNDVTISTSYCKAFQNFASPMTIPRAAVKKMKMVSLRKLL